MLYHKHTLDNGLRLITIPMPAVSSATVMIEVGVGSRYESKETNGVTHFLEHMLFKGTKKRPSARLLSKVIDGIGGEWNAATGKESTSYYIKAGATNIGQAFDILCDMLKNPLLKPAEIEREKNVIVSEIAMYEDTPMRRVGEIFETLLYPDSSLGWDIAGTLETVHGITRDNFVQLYAQFYHPKNMVVSVAGGVTEKEILKLTEKHLGNLKSLPALLAQARQAGQNANLKNKKEIFVQNEPRVLVKEKQTDQTHLVLGVRGNRRGHADRWAEEVLTAILGGGMSSRLWLAVRERRGLAYYVRAEVEHYQDNGYLAISAGVDPAKAREAIKVMLAEVDRFKKKGVSSEELTRGKEFIKGHLSLSLEDTRNMSGFFGSFELLENQIITPEEAKDRIDQVTAGDVARVAKEFFMTERLNAAIIGPYSDSERFKKILRI